MINSYLSSNYEEVNFFDFYRNVFPIGSFEKKGVYEKGKYNGIAVSVGNGDKKIKRFTITDDLDVIGNLVETDDFCLMSPISYIGKSRKSNNARLLYALAIDMDGIDTKENLVVFQNQIEKCDYFSKNKVYWGIPKPTYIVSSGTGMHLYYVFKKPIPLFSNVVKELEKLKRRLTWQIWTQGASELHHNVQYESLFQGFRMVGTITKKGERVRAFKVGSKIDLEFLNNAVPEEYRVTQIQYKSNLSLEQASKKYPDWFEKRIVQKKKKGTWICKRDLYDWWKRRANEAEQGHRYWYIMTLATYAIKCNIDREELEKDAFELMPLLNAKGTEPFIEDDILHALEAFNDSYITYPIDTIVERTGIFIERNKRNGRKQELHLKLCRASLEVLNEANGKALQGRKPYKYVVAAWRDQFPFKSKAECIRETGLSKPTVYKWWDWHNGIEPEEWKKMILEIEEELEDMKSKGIEMEEIPWEQPK
jgi:hypothetical protein